MSDNYENALPDELLELSEQVATDKTFINVPIMMCDLMAVIYAIELHMKENSNVDSFPFDEYIRVRDYFISIVQEAYPKYIDYLYERKPLDDVIKSFAEDKPNGTNN